MLGLVQQVKAVEQLTIEAALTPVGAAGRAGLRAAPAGRLGHHGTGPARGLPGADPGDRRRCCADPPAGRRQVSIRPRTGAGRPRRSVRPPRLGAMARPHAAALVEDAFHRRTSAVLRARGWRPRMISYTGYGSPDFVRVLGRVVLSRNHDEPTRRRRAGQPARAVRRRGGAAGLARLHHGAGDGSPVTVTVGERQVRTRSDRSGYVDVVVRSPRPRARAGTTSR